MLLKTNGLEYDDRVKKECISLTQLNYNVEIAVLENGNESNRGQVYNQNVSFKSYKLWLREIVKGNKFLFFKLIEWFIKLLPTVIKKRDVVWIHDPVMFIFIPFFVVMRKIGRVRKIVWDLHELPPERILKNILFKFIFRYSLGSVDEIIHANKERGDYLHEYLSVNYKFNVIRNFVSEEFSNSNPSPVPNELVQWLNGEKYIFLQSGLYKERCFDSVAESICCNLKIKCVVVGGYNERYLADLKYKYSNFDHYFYVVGMVEQSKIIDYLIPSTLSLILYDSSIKNSELCEPNRLYYAINKRVPVVVGNNLTMANIVKESYCGIILNDCGNNSESIVSGVKYLLNNTCDFNFDYVCNWESQSEIIAKVIS